MTSAAERGTAELEAAGDQVTIRLDDALLANGLADVRWLLHDALLVGARRLVVDLSRVRVLSSSTVACFLWAHRACRARGGAVVLRGANRRTKDLLHRTGLWRVIQIEPRRGRPAR
jgi:anti-anti-sigma factor